MSTLLTVRQKRVLLGVCIALLHTGLLAAQELQLYKTPLIRVYETAEYQGGIQNWDITQDERGLLYVANNFGLLEFDGASWSLYEVPESTKLRSVLVDSGRIYIGGQGQMGYFEANQQGIYEFNSIKDLIDSSYQSFDDVWSIFRYQDYIVFSTVRAIYFYDGQEIKALPFDSPIGFAFPLKDELFVQAASGRLMHYANGVFEPYLKEHFFEQRSIVSMEWPGNGHFLVFTREQGIYQMEADQVTRWSPEANRLLQGKTVNTSALLSNGQVAIGTQSHGLYLFEKDGQLLQHLDKSEGLSNHTIISLHEDRLHNLWVGLNNGINYIELNSPFSLICEKATLPGTGYTAILFEDKAYLGTSNGLFYQPEAGAPYQMVRNSEGQVYYLSPLDERLVLNHHLGAFLVEEGVATPFFEESGTWKMIRYPGQDRYLCGTYLGFYWFEKTSESFSPLGEVEGLTESSRVFEFDEEDHIWMTHGYKGVYSIDFSESWSQPAIEFYNQTAGFPSNIFINVYPLRNEMRFSTESGIFQLAPVGEGFEPDSLLSSLVGWNSHVSELEEDELGNVYFIADKRVGLLRQNSLGNYSKETAIFNRINKYLSDDLENISVLNYRNVLIGAKDGFVHFDPGKVSPKPESYPNFIRQVYLHGKSDSVLYHGQAHQTGQNTLIPGINYQHNSIGFRMAAPYFDSHEDLSYRCRLVNFDKDWVELGSVNQKEYTNLPYGDYVFEAEATNVYGMKSTVARYAFRIIRPWYATRVAYGLYAFIIILPIVAFFRMMDLRHKRERRKLDLTRKQELIHKQIELNETTRKSAEEISQLRNEKLRTEINYKNTQLANTTMHLLNKNELMLQVKTNLQSAVSNDKNLAAEVRKIVKTIDRNISQDDDWQQFEMHFDEVHAGFMKRIKEQYPTLTPQETKLAAFLRMNMTTKEIANLLHNSVRGVEISRYRLRKKLGIDRTVNLVDFMMRF